MHQVVALLLVLALVRLRSGTCRKDGARLKFCVTNRQRALCIRLQTVVLTNQERSTHPPTRIYYNPRKNLGRKKTLKPPLLDGKGMVSKRRKMLTPAAVVE